MNPHDQGRPEPGDTTEAEISEPETVEMEIRDTLDLHSFPPHQVKELVTDWLGLAYDAGHRELRIVHGKGIGVQREMVRKLLQRDPRVVDFGDASDASGWGATRVRMR